ncbi:MAG: phosphoglycerate kinase [Myxococcales bacterium]|nr:phosphoglycerate kinase [Myxococcales bacterium]
MTVRDLDSLLAGDGVKGKRVFVRADLNVPMRGDTITDATRIEASVPTLRRLAESGARVVVASHLGRPKGVRNLDYSLKPVAKLLADCLGRPVGFADDCVGESAESAANALADGELLLLENLRFHDGETANDSTFAKQLAKLADIYVNDAFGTAHRAHGSTAGMVAEFSQVAAGDLLKSELSNLDLLFTPERPFLCLLGGAKVSDKLGVLEALLERADVIAIGGAMAYTFLAAEGKSVGKSLVERDRFEDARRIRKRAVQANCRLLLPTDHVVASSPEDSNACRTTNEIPDNLLGFDIGTDTAVLYADEARKAGTILWNGPMGMFEIPAFAEGTATVAKGVAASSATSVVGGGDSLAAINQLGLADQIDHLSTGGGASLAYVQGCALPGVVALER